jgi:hypothetical protein
VLGKNFPLPVAKSPGYRLNSCVLRQPPHPMPTHVEKKSDHPAKFTGLAEFIVYSDLKVVAPTLIFPEVSSSEYRMLKVGTYTRESTSW